MARLLLTLAVAFVTSSIAFSEEKPKPNVLTPKEIAEGWILLFDGETTFGWEKDANFGVKDGQLVFAAGEKEIYVWHPMRFPDELEVVADWYREGEASFLFDTPEHFQAVRALPPKKHSSTRFSYHREDGAYKEVWRGWLAVDLPDGLSQSHRERKRERARIGFRIKPNSSVVVRSLKLRPLGTQALFNGKNLDGWKVFQGDPKRAATKFEVTKDGELSAKNGPGDLQTEKQFDDFVLQLECKTNGKGLNSGVFFRCIPDQYQNGYEAQIQNAYLGDRTKPLDFGTGAIYRRIAARKVVSNDNEWFTMTLVAQGTHFATWVNGYQTVDWTDDRKANDNPRQGLRTAKGHLSIQGHDPTTDLLFRNIRIAELPKK